MKLRLSPRLVADTLYALYRPWCASLRLTQVNREPVNALFAAGKPFVLALWHNECFTLIYLKEKLKLMTIASQSRDGEYITGVLEHLGFVVARGSSSRGGAGALLTCIKHMREDGLTPAVTMDGPRGPRHKVKDGVLFLAHQAQVPIVALRAFPERCVRFGSWDRFELPLPFSRVRVVFAAPYTIERELLDKEGLKQERARLEAIMDRLAEQ